MILYTVIRIVTMVENNLKQYSVDVVLLHIVLSGADIVKYYLQRRYNILNITQINYRR